MYVRLSKKSIHLGVAENEHDWARAEENLFWYLLQSKGDGEMRERPGFSYRLPRRPARKTVQEDQTLSACLSLHAGVRPGSRRGSTSGGSVARPSPLTPWLGDLGHWLIGIG